VPTREEHFFVHRQAPGCYPRQRAPPYHPDGERAESGDVDNGAGALGVNRGVDHGDEQEGPHDLHHDVASHVAIGSGT